MIRSAITLTSSDGAAELFVRRFEPVRRDNGRTLVVVHGAGEHAGRYGHFIRRATDMGWSVIAGDLRGHGRSGGVPTHLDHFDQYLADLDLIWDHYRLEPQTTAVFAHSMGGLIGVRYVQTRTGRLSALVLSAPLLGLKVRVKFFKQAVGKVCSVIRPTTRFGTVVRASQISRNDDVLAERELDPHMRRTVTAGWFFRIKHAIAAAHEDAGRFDRPLLLLQGEADEIVNSDAAVQWLSKIRTQDVTHRVLAGHRHELINEPGWEQTAADIFNWLDARFAAAFGPQRRAA
ncbi:MAG: lysophospholipase [Planctomycetaceae bacterium]